MSMRINTLVTHLRAEDALTLIEFLDQLRELLIQTYGDEIKTLLQDASSSTPSDGFDDDHTF